MLAFEIHFIPKLTNRNIYIYIQLRNGITIKSKLKNQWKYNSEPFLLSLILNSCFKIFTSDDKILLS